jgi:hypothetical protein
MMASDCVFWAIYQDQQSFEIMKAVRTALISADGSIPGITEMTLDSVP